MFLQKMLFSGNQAMLLKAALPACGFTSFSQVHCITRKVTNVSNRHFSICIPLMKMNAQDYLTRINYHGPIEPTLETLGRLSRFHKAAVPYTNVEFVNGLRKVLDLEILYDRIVVNRGGGVCHEINGLFTWLLRELGFEVILYSAKFYLDPTKEWSVWAGHSFPFVSKTDCKGQLL